MRTIENLNFDWLYSEKFSDEMLRKSYKEEGFEKVDIPHTNKELPLNYFDEKIYQFVSCYRKHFRLPKEAYEEGKKVFLHFEGAANYAVVYVNGKPAGEHKGGYTPFVFDITNLICKDENVIAVELDSTERPEIPPFGYMVDYLVYGGIYREVWLEITDEIYIKDVFVRTPSVINEKKEMLIDVEFSDGVRGNINFELKDMSGKVIASKETKCSGKKIRFDWWVSGVKNWDTDNPNLYYLTVKFGKDEKTARFGFRTCEFRKDGFYLNNKHIKLMGLNRHQSYPYVGNAMPKSAQTADAELLKYRLGCNIVRTSHYPDSIHFIDRCDEIGLVVFTEIPSWQFLGKGEWRKLFIENIKSMILRDRNHPSIILWGVRVNEGQDCDTFYIQANAVAHLLDDSRQTGGVRNFPRSHLFEDVYTYNDFSHSGGLIKLLPPYIVAKNAPYLVTENNGHMYPTKSFDTERVRTEHALRHARVQDKSFGTRRISGAIGWDMADYNTHKDFGSGDRICYHGVTDMFRVPKMAGAVFASQQEKNPVLETSSSMDIGDHPGGMLGLTYIFTNCDYVKIYKNGEYKSTVTPERNSPFKNLPHPPITPLDFIGDALERKEHIDPKAAKYLKKALIAGSRYGYLMPPQHYLELAYAFVKGRFSVKDIVGIVEKYIGGWGEEQVSYRFEGYIGNTLVKTVTRTAVNKVSFTAVPDSDKLCEDETYDVTRIELVARDQNGNKLPYIDETLHVSVDGPVKVIGPDTFSLIGGDRAFWVRTTGKSGNAKITVTSENIGEQVVNLTVEKK